jgi:hypothetical protein
VFAYLIQETKSADMQSFYNALFIGLFVFWILILFFIVEFLRGGKNENGETISKRTFRED